MCAEPHSRLSLQYVAELAARTREIAAESSPLPATTLSEHPRLSVVALGSIATARKAAAHLAEAEEVLGRAIAIADRHLPADDPETGSLHILMVLC
jgi:hypothetical protein